MKSHDWSRFVKRINIQCTTATAYAAWTSRGQLENWFLRKAEFKTPGGGIRPASESVRKGDTYEWLWHGYGDDVKERGEVLEANGVDVFKFVFGKAGTVTVTLSSEEGETIVELKQENIPVDDQSKVNYHVGCLEGWTFYLANLKSYLQGGPDLRNKNMKIAGVVNA
jgi:uncharacterized protein YndB with AHSA1/START domain